MALLAQLVVWLNTAANTLAHWLLAPIGLLPGWLSTTLVSAVTGVLLLLVFKYTSPQRAIKRVRDGIKADLLALKLFKDNAAVALGAQGHLLVGAGKLFVFALVPMLVMIVPVCLILAQLALWYQARPLRVGEEVVVGVTLRGDTGSPDPDVHLRPTDAVAVTIDRVRVPKKHAVYWSLQGRQPGYHRLVFDVAGQAIEKELAIGDDLMRVSTQRPSRNLEDLLLNPGEQPFGPDSPVQAIEIDYPERSSWTSGSDSWLTSWFVLSMKLCSWVGGWFGAPGWIIYWFIVSMIAAFCFRGWLNVNI
jgi:hypothetical protein